MTNPAAPMHPPEAPEQRPQLRLSRAQWIGLPVLALVPALALAGLFGERSTSVQQAGGPLMVAMHSPTRLRYRQRLTLDVSVTNRGREALQDVRVRIDSAYLDRFSNVALAPQASPDGSVSFGAVAPASSVRLAVTMEGERAGRARAVVAVTDAAGDTVRLPLSTVVFP